MFYARIHLVETMHLYQLGQSSSLLWTNSPCPSVPLKGLCVFLDVIWDSMPIGSIESYEIKKKIPKQDGTSLRHAYSRSSV